MEQNHQIFISDRKVATKYEVSKQTIWRWVLSDPTFPRPVKLSGGCTRWKLSELEAWEAGKSAP